MATRYDFETWVVEALEANGGKATPLEVSVHVWENHEDELRDSGNLFYTWQYDIRWASTRLRHEGVLVGAKQSGKGLWVLAEQVKGVHRSDCGE